MHIQRLSFLNFKNYEQLNLEFCPGINCLIGDNGEGKTNILDGLHYLSFCKSYFNPIDSQNILHDHPFFVIQGTVSNEAGEDEIYCAQKRNQKKQFKRNKVEYSRLADHIGRYPMVMISPSDNDLIHEGSESRRRFLDSVLSQFDSIYLDDLINYNKILSQRNALLKKFAETGRFLKDSIEIWDMQLIEFAQRIYLKRSRLIAEFIPVFQKYYEAISQGKEKVNINYQSHLLDTDFSEVLAKAIERDRALQYTTVGTHKDDLEFTIRKQPVKKYGSQGQQKTYLIALKLAQYEYMRNVMKKRPILLLDDIHDKLDENRVRGIMALVSQDQFGQIFITDTHPSRIALIFENNPAMSFKQYRISNGTITPTHATPQ